MKFNKDIFVSEEIKTEAPRLIRRQIILTVVIGIVLVALFIAVYSLLWKRFGEDFMAAYAYASFITCAVAIAFVVIVPFDLKIRKLIKRQAEEFIDRPVYEKYLALYRIEREKFTQIILIVGISVGLSLTWLLAILYPYKAYAMVGFVAPSFVISVLLLVLSYFKQRKVDKLEVEILKEHNKEY